MSDNISLDTLSFVRRRDKTVFYSREFPDDELISLVAQTGVTDIHVYWEFFPKPNEWHVQCYSESFVGGFGLWETSLMRGIAGAIILGWLAERDFNDQYESVE